jgi:hypothetical protein
MAVEITKGGKVLRGRITGDSEDKKFLESLGVKVGPYNREEDTFEPCEVSAKALDKLEPHWGRFFWVLE